MSWLILIPCLLFCPMLYMAFEAKVITNKMHYFALASTVLGFISIYFIAEYL